MNKTKPEKSNIGIRRRQAQVSGDAEYQQRREELFAVAGQIFREKGFDGASINDFAKAIGIDRASIYYYISGKEELFQEVVQKAVKENVEMIEAIEASSLTPAGKVREFIVGLMRSYERHFPYLYVYVQEDMARITTKDTLWSREMKKSSNRFDAAAENIIDEGIKTGTIKANGAPARVIALAIIGMCNWSHRWFHPAGKISAELIGQHFSNMVLNGILAKPREADPLE